MKKCYIYIHTRLDKDEVFYVGIGTMADCDIKRQRAHHTKYRNRIWKSIVRKSEYKIDIYADKLTWEEACKIEIELIAKFGRKNLGAGTLANLTDGGDGVFGMVHSEEAKEKMRLKKIGRKHTPEHIEKVASSRRGKKLSPERCEAIRLHQIGNKNGAGKRSKEFCEESSKRQKGVKRSPEAIKNMADGHRGKRHKGIGLIEAYKNGIKVGEYRNTYEAAEMLNCHQQLISKVLTGVRKKTNGLTFKRLLGCHI